MNLLLIDVRELIQMRFHYLGLGQGMENLDAYKNGIKFLKENYKNKIVVAAESNPDFFNYGGWTPSLEFGNILNKSGIPFSFQFGSEIREHMGSHAYKDMDIFYFDKEHFDYLKLLMTYVTGEGAAQRWEETETSADVIYIDGEDIVWND